MKAYAFSDYGFVLEENVAKLICEKKVMDGSIDSVQGGRYCLALLKEDFCDAIDGFDGCAFLLDDTGRPDHFVYDEYETTAIYYIPLRKRPNLCGSAYDSLDDILAELRERLGKYLPADYDYRDNLRYINGVTYDI